MSQVKAALGRHVGLASEPWKSHLVLFASRSMELDTPLDADADSDVDFGAGLWPQRVEEGPAEDAIVAVEASDDPMLPVGSVYGNPHSRSRAQREALCNLMRNSKKNLKPKRRNSKSRLTETRDVGNLWMLKGRGKSASMSKPHRQASKKAWTSCFRASQRAQLS